MEAATSQLLTHHAGDQRLARVYERLELSNDQTGRLAFLKALELLSTDERRFVRRFSELRNRLVHNVHNVRSRFADDFETMDSNQRDSFIEWSTFFATDPKARQSWRDSALNAPKLALFYGVTMIVSSCLQKTMEAKYRHNRIERALGVLEASGLEDEDDADDSQ